MKVSRLKPTDSGFIRIEFEVTPEEVEIAQEFAPESMEVRDKEGNIEFRLEARQGVSNSVKNRGVRVNLPEEDKETYQQPLQVLVNFESQSEAQVMGTLVRARKMIKAIEKNIKAANKEYTEAQAEIEEV